MASTTPDTCIRITLLNPQGQPLGGTVDLEFRPQHSGQTVNVKGVDASKAIDVSGLQRAPNGIYQLTVTPADVFRPVSQFVTIPASGFTSVTITIDKGTVGAPPPPIRTGSDKLQGSLAFDYGLPADGIAVRLYHVGFGGQDTLLGEVRSDAHGKYVFSYAASVTGTANLQVRALDPAGKEVTISATKYVAGPSETMNLVVPASVRPLAPEVQRLSADLDRSIGGIAKLGQAQEGEERQDLTLLSQSTRWDARLVALAATAVQQAAAVGLGHDVLYGIFRVGLPTDPAILATVPAATFRKALEKATKSGIVNLDDRQISAATARFQEFSTRTLLASRATGSVSTFDELLAPNFSGNPSQQAAFASLFFSQPPNGTDLWEQAAQLDIPAAALNSLQLQGKFLYLTFNNAPLAQVLQHDVGSLDQLSKMADKDYHKPDKWKDVLTTLAGTGGDKALDALIPSIYQGRTAAARLTAYSGDLARRVRMSFPTEVAARMVEGAELTIPGGSATNVATFLRSASSLGYSIGRTPLNRFLTSAGGSLPALDDADKHSVKTLHRLYQVTPSNESLQAALNLGFTSAFDIASLTKEEFMKKHAHAFPSREAEAVYGRSQTISSVTLNFFSWAKQIDYNPPMFALSGSSDDRQNTKDALVQQFPSIASLFGNLDFCECQECRSVLSPAAYFVDVLDLLGQHSAPNDAGYTPLDVLIGKDEVVPGRRPDLGALPVTCENTNTAMPYIDLVNEILEYYIANSHLDAKAAYDTGSATTEDLIAEPQHILPDVYSSTLRQALFPIGLPFDLWIDTVRAFLDYFKTPLSRVLDTLRPAGTLELFSGSPATPYYRAQILAEALGISPAEYSVLTVFNTATWFQLYGAYPDETTALNDLKSAKTLSQRLDVTYRDVTELVSTGFLNPSLYALIFQFERLGIDLGSAFSFTNQPGYPALDPQAAASFGAQLDGITEQYLNQNNSSTFDARAWLNTVLPPNYSRTVLVLADPDTGCNFSGTTLQYADGSPATPLDFLKINLFVRLWKKLGWTLDELDRALQVFFPPSLPDWASPAFAGAFGAAWKTALVYLAHLDDLNTQLAPDLGRAALLPFWANLPVQGRNPLYAQLFLSAGVLNNDGAFDDPNGRFPWLNSDLSLASRPLSAHQAEIQGVLGLTAAEITAILEDASVAAPAEFSLANLSMCYRYSLLARCLELPVADLIALRTMSGTAPFQPLAATPLQVLADDILLTQTLAFVSQAMAVQNSGFTVEDLRYLLRHQFDPVGKYQSDPNALTALVQSVANGLRQIQKQNAAPADLAGMSESLIDQRLSGLFPAPMLKTLFAHLANSQTYTASQAGVLTNINPLPFAGETRLTFDYDPVTQIQTVGFQGLLLDWKKAQLEHIDPSALFSALLDAVQQQAEAALRKSIGDILGVWASLVQYDAVATGVPPAQAIADPLHQFTQADASLSFLYDEAGQLQWLGYRGVLTDVQMSVLTGINNSPTLAPLLAAVQQQPLPAYSDLIGSLLAMWTNVQTYSAVQTAVAPANQIDAAAFAAALAVAQQNGTIVDPVPDVQFSYDDASQTQTITCTGVLTAATQVLVAPLLPSPILPGLLSAIRSQGAQLYQTLAAGLLTVGPNDLDHYVTPFLGVNSTRQQKGVKAELVKVFLPLLTQKLSRQFVLQTLSGNLASNPSLTEALVTDAALLNDPSDPGRSLLKAFLAVGEQGVSATYYSSTGLTGPPLAGGTAATTDTADPSNSVPGAASCRFEGYLQVPTDGPYRFFGELGNLNCQIMFRVNSPDPAALLPSPTILQTASKDGDEASQYIVLKGGVAYAFTLEFQSLGANGATLLIQGENLPKGPLSQVVLLPLEAVMGFDRARTLLSKVLQILQVTGLGEREVSYLTSHAAQFNNLRLSGLPTREEDSSIPTAVALFSQFLTLTDYADLRTGPAGGTDGLIDVFQAASETSPPTPPSAILATLTRRDPQVVQDVAAVLGPEPHFVNNTGIRRVWDALQVVQIVRLPVTALSAATALVATSPPSPEAIAGSFKNAVKAQYSPEQWRPIAKSVYDELRRKKRDALVSYLVNELGLESANQLFEYFLVDPGMEPVVQTSRLRLAMSSVQTFVQRCLLNLENGNTGLPARNVAPNAIRADWWAWMKRYRVWQANREIFLFPENWMEPELRLDKTDLFQALESDLLQGDVTNDLVEDAFLTYLKGLDARARLDIITTHLEQDLEAGISILHVLGRTHGHPHKYFYRTYANELWSGWEAVPLDIESDHIALAIWRDRPNLFWLKFLIKSEAPPRASGHDPTKGAASYPFDTLSDAITSGKAQKQVQIQLNWSEYVQGKWSKPISTDVKKYKSIDVPDDFDARNVHIHVSKESDSEHNEGAIRIHADFPYSTGELHYKGKVIFPLIPGPNHAFRVTSRNCDPDLDAHYWEPPQSMPYITSGVDATFYTGSTKLTASFKTAIHDSGSGSNDSEDLLRSLTNFDLLTCDNTVVPPYLDQYEPLYTEAGALVSPFFFKDTSNPSAAVKAAIRDERTFFVQPSLTETVVREWKGWAISNTTVNHFEVPDNIYVVSQIPDPVPIDPGDPVYSIFPMQNLIDWATDPAVAISYGGVAIGKNGGMPATAATVFGGQGPSQPQALSGTH